MAKTDEKVMEMVEKEIRKNADLSSADLFEKAKATEPSLNELTLRQFHARYPLQVKRRMALAESGGRAAKPKRSRSKSRKASAPARRSRKGREGSRDGAGDREQVRRVLLKFAADLSAAEARKDLVKVLANVDRYVDDVLKAAT